MPARLLLAALLVLSLGACQSPAGDSGFLDEGFASGGLDDDCTMRSVGSSGLTSSLVCH